MNRAAVADKFDDALPPRNWINTAYASTFGAGLLFFVVSFVALGVIPATLLHAEMARTTPAGVSLKLTASELRGREITRKTAAVIAIPSK